MSPYYNPGIFLSTFPYLFLVILHVLRRDNVLQMYVFLGMFNLTNPKHPILKHPQRRLMVFENRVLRRILGPKREEVTREWKKLHNKELNDLYYAPQCFAGDKIQKNAMGRACSAYGGEERCIQGFGGET